MLFEEKDSKLCLISYLANRFIYFQLLFLSTASLTVLVPISFNTLVNNSDHS